MNARLEPLRSFILPGGTPLAAHLHLCRTVCRGGPNGWRPNLPAWTTSTPTAVKYLNRLSDWFFVAARIANRRGPGDVLWVPGANALSQRRGVATGARRDDFALFSTARSRRLSLAMANRRRE